MRRKKRIFLLALALAALLSSCAVTPEPEASSEPEPVVTEPSRPQTVTGEGYERADDLFSINYSPDSSLNPLLTSNRYNEQLMGLLYEGLFALSPQLEAVPVLCRDCVTEDGVTYRLSLLEGVKFHDGTVLTADDVVYSLNTARSSSKYSSRLSDIGYVGATEDGGVEIRLKRANRQLPKLLDVPIIKSGTAEDESPQGTGPYIMGSGMLTAFTSHRDYGQESLRRICLRSTAEDALAEDFSARNLDLLGFDPTGSETLNIHMVHETRYYDTSDLIYLGFNCKKTVAGDQLVRRAILRLIDRESIVTDIFGSFVVSSPFILNPVTGLYDETDTAGYGLSKADFDRLAMVAGLEDMNADGYLDYGEESFSMRFIVNSESPFKVSAAQKITTDLRNAGFNVTLDILTYNQYVSALNDGDFDIYMGEVRLRADMDITSLAAGKLNYGKITDTEYVRLIQEYLAAPEGDERREAAAALDIYVVEDAALIPICYKRHAVLTHVGVVSGAEPSQSGLYRGVLGWTVDP